MKEFFENNPLKTRLAAFSLFVLLLVLFYNELLSMGFNFFDKSTIGEFFLKSRILFIIAGALFGGMLIYFVKMKARFRAMLMALSFILFGILPAFGDAHCFFKVSSSLCAIIKPLLFVSQGIYNIPIKYFVLLTSIIILSLIGKNLYCGWVCPIGAIQEAVHFASPVFIKRRVPFALSNSIRILIFVSSIALLFAAGINLYYDYLNPFVAIQWKLRIFPGFFTSLSVLLTVIAASLLFYRPYCYLICPIGLFTWVSTHFSIYRVKCDMERCTQCMTCIDETACPAIRPIIENRLVVPDCFQCGQCIKKCPENALRFTAK